MRRRLMRCFVLSFAAGRFWRVKSSTCLTGRSFGRSSFLSFFRAFLSYLFLTSYVNRQALLVFCWRFSCGSSVGFAPGPFMNAMYSWRVRRQEKDRSSAVEALDMFCITFLFLLIVFLWMPQTSLSGKAFSMGVVRVGSFES